MTEIIINDKISYIEHTSSPLSADIGIIRSEGEIWLFDVGNDIRTAEELNESYNVVLSHFHADHIGSLDRINVKEVYSSRETFRHINRGIIAENDLYIGELHIFSLPSSHSKGCVGLEVGEYAFAGDALYGRVKDGKLIYNSQLLKEEIDRLKKLEARFLLVSHRDGFIRNKSEIITELEEIYGKRTSASPFIEI